MIKPNNPEGNQSKPTLGELASNTRLDIPNTTPTTTNKYSKTTDANSFQRLDPTEETLTVFHSHSDWLSVSFERLSKSQFEELINLTGRGLIVLEKDTSWSSGEKAKTYENTINSPNGLKGAYSCYQTEDNINTFYDVTISLSGQYFSSLTTIEQWSLYRDLYTRYQAKCSRTDAAIDDYSFNKIPLNQMIEAYKDGNYFDFREYSKNEEYTSPDNFTTTYYFGSKGSKKLVRIYNHKNESLRLETQFRGKYAQIAFEAIANLERDDKTDEEWTKIIQKTIGGIAVGAIDFRDRSKLNEPKKASKSKTKRFPFWQDLIDNVGAVHMIRIPKIKPDLETYQDTFNWLEKMASKTLAILFYVIGQERFISYIYRLVKVGESKFTPQDKKRIEYLRGNLDYLDFD